MASKAQRRFRASQAAHKRLKRKHNERMKYHDDAWVPAQYHSSVYDWQDFHHEIAPKKTREKIYERVRKSFFD